MPLPYQQYVTLKFPSMEALWHYQHLAGLRNYHFDRQDCTLRAQLTDKQMELAIILKATREPQQQTG